MVLPQQVSEDARLQVSEDARLRSVSRIVAEFHG